ncbi:MAG: hypothetical protein B6U85_06895 [Desulfurococcales archaeon ex4484_42]|nr:MAG: hypothetical protein B6U85_06895 [Desulfurococcales archaeon ex4484_42]
MSKSLKEFIDKLRSLGLIAEHGEALSDVYEVTKVLWGDDDKELTSLFRVKGKERFLCVGNLVNSRRKVMTALGVPDIVSAYRMFIEAETKRGKLREVGFSDYFKRTDLTLSKLPAIKFYEGDGGRYITSAIFISRSLDGVLNASIHRVMIIDENKAAVRVVPRHLYRMYLERVKRGEDLPVAVVIGVHPAVMLASAFSPPYGVFELEIASLFLNGLDVVRTPKHDLPIPAHASVVIEGYLSRERVKEGPFVDLLMTYDEVRMEPVFVAESIYINKQSNLFHVILPGGREHQILMGFPREAAIWYSVSKVVPKVKAVRLTYGGSGWLHAVIAIEKNVDGDAKNAILAAFAAHPSLKHVVVVDTDIDVDNPHDVEWAIATRAQASKDLIIIKSARGSSLDPSAFKGITDKIGIDATAPIADRERYIKAKIPK